MLEKGMALRCGIVKIGSINRTPRLSLDKNEREENNQPLNP